MKIYLIRHAHYYIENEGYEPLTQKGIIQTTKLAERFIQENIQFNKIYSSPKKKSKRYCRYLL